MERKLRLQKKAGEGLDMKLLNIKSYTCNYTKKKISVIPPKTMITIAFDGKESLAVVKGIYKYKPRRVLDNKYEYVYVIEKLTPPVHIAGGK